MEDKIKQDIKRLLFTTNLSTFQIASIFGISEEEVKKIWEESK